MVSHMISKLYGNSSHVTSLHSIGTLRIHQEIFLATLRVLTLINLDPFFTTVQPGLTAWGPFSKLELAQVTIIYVTLI